MRCKLETIHAGRVTLTNVCEINRMAVRAGQSDRCRKRTIKRVILKTCRE